MERTCSRCQQVRANFKKIVDADSRVLFDSVCKACRAAEPKAKRQKRVPKTVPLPQARAAGTAGAKVPVKEARDALKHYKLGDVRDPVALITGPCHFTGVCPAMCLDLLDRKGRADDGNVVPCEFYVRAARGQLRASEFVALCVAIADGAEQSAAGIKESMAMSARFDAAGGTHFMDMCKACRSSPKLAEA